MKISQRLKLKDMSLKHILQEIEKLDEIEYSRPDPRRALLRHLGTFTKKAMFTALPFGLLTTTNRVSAQTVSVGVIEPVLQLALIIKRMQAEFYTLGINASALVPAGIDLDALTTIKNQETQHVRFLDEALKALGKVPAATPSFDFTGGKGVGTGPFANVFTNYDTFLTLAQILEDTGVRALKGQIPELLGAGSVITNFLNLHSVEARHASHVRRMRMARGVNVKPWITGKDSAIGANAQLSYDGEETTTQAGIDIIDINGQSVSSSAASESFDEPLTKEQALIILDPFIV